MNSEIRISVVKRLPEDDELAAAHCQTVFAAWRAFTEAIKAVHPEVNDFNLGCVKEPVRRRRGRPRLTVAEPPTAA